MRWPMEQKKTPRGAVPRHGVHSRRKAAGTPVPRTTIAASIDSTITAIEAAGREFGHPPTHRGIW